MKKTKIVCTLGPASSSEDVLSEMLMCGMNVARFNFSHGTHAYHKELMDRFKQVRDKLGVPAAIMLDTKGPEIRLGEFEGGKATLVDGDEFILTTEEVLGTAQRASVTYNQLPQKLSRDNHILIDDGRISLSVHRRTQTEIFCTVEKQTDMLCLVRTFLLTRSVRNKIFSRDRIFCIEIIDTFFKC